MNISKSVLTSDEPDRFVLFPINHKPLWDMYEEQRAAFWWDTDVAFSAQDEKDWESLSDGERYFMENILAFFASADGVVMENIAERLLSEIKLPEARAFLTIQLMIELNHSIVYAKLLDGYVRNAARKTELLRANQNIPIVKAKTDWALKWISSPAATLAERLVAYACVEGIHFQGEFCAIFWMKEKRKLGALTFANYLISRDEYIHLKNGCLWYRSYIPENEKLSQDKLAEIIWEAVDIEKNFINGALDCGLLGMNRELMGEYIEHVANMVCSMLGHSSVFPSARNPFPFMDRLAFDVKENFFETRVSSYKMPKTTEVHSTDDLEFDSSF
jgi:ribonucleotide reductase beta subunit family protein with ferritin-like domain